MGLSWSRRGAAVEDLQVSASKASNTLTSELLQCTPLIPDLCRVVESYARAPIQGKLARTIVTESSKISFTRSEGKTVAWCEGEAGRSLLYTRWGKQTIRVFDFETGEALLTFKVLKDFVSLAVSYTGSLIAVGYKFPGFSVYNRHAQHLCTTYVEESFGPGCHLTLCDATNELFARGTSKTIDVFRATDGTALRTLTGFSQSALSSTAINRTGTRLFVVMSGCIAVCDPLTGAELAHFGLSDYMNEGPFPVICVRNYPFSTVCCIPRRSE